MELRVNMERASESLEFERAAVLRDQLRAIESVSQNQKVVSNRNEDADVIALAYDKGEAWVELFRVRRGKLIGRDHFVMEGGEAEDEPALLEHFVQQFYEASTDVPGTLLMQHDIEDASAIAEWLGGKRGRRVSIYRPQRGEKRQLVQMAAANAVEALAQRRIQWLHESDKVLQALAELQEELSLPELPRRIECYDISNIQGTNSVGSMVVFENGRPKSGHYRRFQIKGVSGIDDYAPCRRCCADASAGSASSGRAEAEAAPSTPLPDGAEAPEGPDGQSEEGRSSQNSFGFVPGLVIIDGGKGHLNAAQEVFLELGLTDIPLCSLAKREEEVFLPHVPEPVLLPRRSQGLYLVQRVRDEAHRFAITYHRQRRSRAATRSRLDDAPGIGPKRRRELIRRFGSAAGVRAASVEELAGIRGMSRASAEQLKAFLGGDDAPAAP